MRRWPTFVEAEALSGGGSSQSPDVNQLRNVADGSSPKRRR